MPLRPDSAAAVPSPPEVVPSKMLYEVAPVLAVQARLREPAVALGAETVTPVGAAGTVVTLDGVRARRNDAARGDCGDGEDVLLPELQAAHGGRGAGHVRLHWG